MSESIRIAAPLVRKSEGLRLVAYVCPAGVLTNGYGHTGLDVKHGQSITTDQADAWLHADLEVAQRIVRKYVRARLTVNQEAALISFAFNIGGPRFSGSTLVRLLNKGDYTCVPAQLARWNKGTVKGRLVVLPGLVTRRAAEGVMWGTA